MCWYSKANVSSVLVRFSTTVRFNFNAATHSKAKTRPLMSTCREHCASLSGIKGSSWLVLSTIKFLLKIERIDFKTRYQSVLISQICPDFEGPNLKKKPKPRKKFYCFSWISEKSLIFDMKIWFSNWIYLILGKIFKTALKELEFDTEFRLFWGLNNRQLITCSSLHVFIIESTSLLSKDHLIRNNFCPINGWCPDVRFTRSDFHFYFRR